MIAHTPEKWEIVCADWDADGNARFTMNFPEHDARKWTLIKAAPDLLEALKDAVLQIEYMHEKFTTTGTGNAMLARIRAAIARATGGEP